MFKDLGAMIKFVADDKLMYNSSIFRVPIKQSVIKRCSLLLIYEKKNCLLERNSCVRQNLREFGKTTDASGII